MWSFAALAVGLIGAASAAAQPPSDSPQPAPAPKTPPPPYEFKMGEAHPSINPFTHGSAKVQEGKIEVTTEDNTLKAVLTGGAGANVFLGFESIATQSFHLEQPLEIRSTDPTLRDVVLTVDSSLLGYVRSKHKASACVHVAHACLTPLDGGGPPLVIDHPRPCVMGPSGECCGGPLGTLSKDPLPPRTGPVMPLGRYLLQVDFMIQATAGGIIDAHSTAIFAPEPKDLDSLEREHDPYKDEDKKDFGFTIVLTAGLPPGRSPSAAAEKKERPPVRVASRAPKTNGARARRPQSAAAPRDISRPWLP